MDKETDNRGCESTIRANKLNNLKKANVQFADEGLHLYLAEPSIWLSLQWCILPQGWQAGGGMGMDVGFTATSL